MLMSEVGEQRVVAWGQELRKVHARLREALDIARDSVADGVPPALATSDLQLFCRGFCAALAGHHTSEDQTMFPLVAEQRPDLVPVIAQLRQDHNMIGHLIGELDRALRGDATPTELLRHLDGIGAVMETHFRYEERRLIEVLDLVLDPGLDSRDLFGPIA